MFKILSCVKKRVNDFNRNEKGYSMLEILMGLIAIGILAYTVYRGSGNHIVSGAGTATTQMDTQINTAKNQTWSIP